MLVPSLIRPGEAVDVDNIEALAIESASVFLRLSQRADVQQLLASGVSYYEVPFSFINCERGPTPARRAPALEDALPSRGAVGADADDVENTEVQGATVVRGRIDCVVDCGERLTILEFKTGGARPEHEAQISTYVAALRKIFPSREIDARLIYP
jgi:ATP-dependent exoDNAse (exonuclease V) beta subunit